MKVVQPILGNLINRSHSLVQGLEGCWLFNELGGQIARDSSRNVHGALTNGAIFSSNNLGQCISFDGTNDYVSISTTKAIANFNPRISISSWIKTTYSGGLIKRIYATASNISNTPYVSQAMQTTGVATLQARNDANVNQVLDGTIAINDGKWHNIVTTIEYNSTWCVYVDGKLDTTTTKAHTGAVTLSNTHIGTVINTASPSGVSFWSGLIGSVMVWNRVLTSSEIRQLYFSSYQMFN